MDQQIDVDSLVERADELLLQGDIQQAAGEYARAVHQNPNAVEGHLGIAKAYFALGNFGYVYMACREVQRLAPGSANAAIAQAILFVLERNYDGAIRQLNEAERLSPGQAYVHALRAYCYRQIGNSYDALSASSKAARLSGVRDWSHLFPKIETPPPVPQAIANGRPDAAPVAPAPSRTQTGQRSPMQRRMIQARFQARGVPVMTFSLIAINILIYLVGAAITGNFIQSYSPANPLYANGVEYGRLMIADPIQFYRIFTAMFLHVGLIHIGLNMLSLYFIGVFTEQVFGSGRFAVIYFVSGIVGGLAQAFLTPDAVALGASGAIFGVFGALGAFFLLRRRSLGPAGNALIAQWVFWLLFNLYFTFSAANIGAFAHLGGLVTGFALGIIMLNTMMGRKAY